MKLCRGCGEEKPDVAFSKCSRTKDGLQWRCRDCRRAYRAANRDREQERGKRYREEHRTETAARVARWQRENPDKVRAKQQRYAERHPGRQGEAGRRHYESNRDEVLARSKQRYHADPEASAAKNRRWYERNKARNHDRAAAYRARKRGATVEPVSRDAVYLRDEGICQLCQQPVEPDAFEVDHVIPLAAGGEHSMANVQLAHRFCNRSKGARLSAT